MVWHAEKTSVCRFKNVPVCTGTTPACVKTCGRGAGTHGDVLNLHTEVFWTDTQGRERGGRGEGGHRQFCLPRLVHVVITCSRGSPKETSGCYKFQGLRTGRERHVPDSSNHSLSLIKLFSFSCPERHFGGNDKHNTHPPTHHHHHHHSLPPLPPTHTTHPHDHIHKHKETHTKRTHTHKRTRTRTCICTCTCICQCICL